MRYTVTIEHWAIFKINSAFETESKCVVSVELLTRQIVKIYIIFYSNVQHSLHTVVDYAKV